MCCPLKVRVTAVSEHKGPQPGLWASGSICISPATLPVLQELPPDRPSRDHAIHRSVPRLGRAGPSSGSMRSQHM